jgi:hypothetical protein
MLHEVSLMVHRTTRAVLLVGCTLVLAVSAAAPVARATPVLITFDAGDPIGGLAVGATLSNQYAAFGVTFSPNAFSGAGGPTGPWATNTNMSIASSTGGDVGGLGTPSLVSGNLLRSFNGWLAENGDPSFRATFSAPISTLSAAFAGMFAPASTRLFAYDGSTLVATAVGTAPTTGQQLLTVSAARITSVVFTPGDFNDWVGVDNISFTPAAVTPVPEPSSLALSALGVMAVVGWRANRRRRAVA